MKPNFSLRAAFLVYLGALSSFAWAFSPAQQKPQATPNRAQAYYHYSLAHQYEEMGGATSRPEFFTKAIEEFKLAMQFDPNSAYLSAELAELYAHTGRIREAVEEGEEVLKRDPDNIDARRLLGRIYVRNLGDGSGNRQSQTELLRRATEQYEKITQLDPTDVESFLVLGRLYRVSNDFTKAEAALKKALALEPDSEDTLITLADMYRDLGDARGAVDLLERVTKKNAQPRLLALLGQSYEQARDYPKAVEAFRKALEMDKGNLDFTRSLGQNLLNNEQYDEALKQFQRIVEAEPQDGAAFLRLGQIYRQKRQYDLALENFKKAQALSPDSMEVPYNLALLYETQGRTDDAVAVLKKLLDETAKPAGAEYTIREKTNRAIFVERLGFLYRNEEKYTEAAGYFRQLIDLDPENPGRGYAHVIETLRQAHDYKKARDEADNAVKRFPQDQTLKLTRASLLADSGRLDEGIAALKDLLTAAQADKKSDKGVDSQREIWITIAQVYEKARKFPEAVAAIAEADRLTSGKDQKGFIYFLWGSILERAKKADEAEQQFRRALAIDPESAMTLNYLGYMLADRGTRLDEAVKLITHALEIEPQNGAYMDSLGWAYFKQNRMDLAEEYLLKATRRVAHDATIRDHLADVYFKTNRTREALREWTTALHEYERMLPGETDPDELAKVQKKFEDAKVRLAKETKNQQN